MIKKISPTQRLKIGYDQSKNAIEFCNWYVQNINSLVEDEIQIINSAYENGVNDAIQDMDHLYKNPIILKNEYYKTFFIIPNND